MCAQVARDETRRELRRNALTRWNKVPPRMVRVYVNEIREAPEGASPVAEPEADQND
jgi:hypothetical protein